MKAIQKETIICHSTEYFIFTEPLYDFLKLLPKEHVYHPSQTADWRGYYANWEIRNKKLYLFGFTGYIVNHEIEGIEYFFPNQKEVFANWYSGEIGIRMPKEVPTESPSEPFDYFFLKFIRGIHIGTRLYEEYKDNDFNEIDNDSVYVEAPF
jgi:hypothetical protein